MCDRKYQALLRGLLDFDLKVLYPWKTDVDQKRYSKLFKLFNWSHISLVMLLLTFTCYERNDLHFSTVTENLAISLMAFRSGVYVWFVFKFHGAYDAQLKKIFDNRVNLPSDQNERGMTEKIFKREYRSVLIVHWFAGISGCLIFPFFAYIFPNDYQLPLNCYILFLPPDGYLFAWELNYLFMIVALWGIVLFFMCYVPLPLLMMNQTCWLLDMALMTADQMNKDLKPDDDISELERVEKTNDHLKKFVARCEKIVEWRSELQELLQWNFDLEFEIQSIILCLTIYFLSLDLMASFIVQNVFLICLVQLFVYCWMGTRITDRIDQLSFEISKNWNLMPPKQRKVVSMVLHWTQNMEGFTGTFKDLSLETFQAVLEASYSFYTFLQSTKT